MQFGRGHVRRAIDFFRPATRRKKCPRQVAGAEIGRTVLELLLVEARRGQITVESLHPRGVKVMGEGRGRWVVLRGKGHSRPCGDGPSTVSTPWPRAGMPADRWNRDKFRLVLRDLPSCHLQLWACTLWLGGGYGARKPMCLVTTANQNINQAAINFTRS
jgi:hypothetical protein